MLRTALLIPVTILCLSTSGQYTATVRTAVVKLENASWRTWKSDDRTMNYPGNWTLELGGLHGLSALFLSHADSATGQQDRVEVLEQERAGRSLETIANTGAADLGERLTDVKELGQSTEGEMLVREYSASMNGASMRIKRQYRVQGDRVHVLTYMAVLQHYEESLYMADAMFASFSTR